MWVPVINSKCLLFSMFLSLRLLCFCVEERQLRRCNWEKHLSRWPWRNPRSLIQIANWEMNFYLLQTTVLWGFRYSNQSQANTLWLEPLPFNLVSQLPLWTSLHIFNPLPLFKSGHSLPDSIEIVSLLVTAHFWSYYSMHFTFLSVANQTVHSRPLVCHPRLTSGPSLLMFWRSKHGPICSLTF